jgi:hypothetical protein
LLLGNVFVCVLVLVLPVLASVVGGAVPAVLERSKS